jgi:FixJ family two-component response regulator
LHFGGSYGASTSFSRRSSGFFGRFAHFIVDDDKSVSDALTLLLRLEGSTTQGFGDGRSFLEAIRARTPACVILDLQLPGYGGLSVLKDLAELRFTSPSS